jgi:acyl-CoA synthetase (NDP forming)
MVAKGEGRNLEYVFHPRSIAVVGASAEPGKQGHLYLELLRDFGFSGKVYAVNPKLKEIIGVMSYPSLKDIPEPVDYVICCIPAPSTPQLISECVAKGVKVVHLFTGRFGETGNEEGARLEAEIVRIAKNGGIHLIGPNCMGIYYPKAGLAFKFNSPKEGGDVGFLSQSGNNAVALCYRGSLRGLRFSKVISYGNACDLNESDFLEYFACDPETKIIAAYIEGVKDGPRFVRALREAAQVKPVVALKGGRTEAGTRAVASHTGALAGSNIIWDALLNQAGVVQVDDLQEMADMILAFKFLTPPKGRNVGVIGAGGGGSVQAADDCERAGLSVLQYPPEIRDGFKRLAPDIWNWIGNPIDVSIFGGSGTVTYEITKLVANHPKTDALIVGASDEWFLDRAQGEALFQGTIQTFIKLGKECQKPMAIVLGPAGVPEDWRWKAVIEAERTFVEAGFPVFPTLSRAAKALSRLIEHRDRLLASASIEDKQVYSISGMGGNSA